MISMKTLAAALAAVLMVLAAGSAQAQQKYATGAVATPPELLQSVPETEIFRDFLPESVDLSRYFPPVGDQMQQGSCVGWATAYAARAYYAKQVEGRDTNDIANIPSPAWIFNLITLSEGCDQGSYIYDAMVTLQKGAESLKDYPYDDTKCNAPSQSARSRATDFQIEAFERVDTQDLDQVKGELAKGHPIVVIALLDNAFFDLRGRKVWKSDGRKENAGGHAFAMVGYDDKAQTFKFINSWNTSWGDEGYGYMSYDTFLARIAEGYVMTLPGDPEVVLEEADYQGLPEDDTPPPPVFNPPLNLRPAATRDINDEPIEVGDLTCGLVNVITDKDGSTIGQGFVSNQADLDRVNAALDGKVDSNTVEVAPWPKCEVMLTLAAQLADSDVPQALVDPESPRLGEEVAIGIKTPGFNSYVYAAYFTADGSVINLTQPSSKSLKPKSSHTQLTFAGDEPGQSGLTVGEPVGDEMLLVVASEAPLFDAARPDIETNRQFLSGLREAVLAGNSGRVTATLLPVTTTQ